MDEMEMMEQETTTELTEAQDGYLDAVNTESEGGHGKAVVAVIGAVVALGGLAIAGVKKLKSKNSDKPKKPKTKWKLVKVPVESEDTVEEVPETDFEEVEE